MSGPAPRPHWRHSEAARWAACTAVALGLHASLAVAMLRGVDDTDEDGGAPVVMVELAPVTTAPDTSPSDLAVGPSRTESERQEQPTRPPEPEPRPADAERAPESEPVDQPEVPVPTEAAPKPPLPATDPDHEESMASAPPSASTSAPQARTAATGQPERNPPASVTRWRMLLAVQLNRHKRYPAAAKGRTGVTRVAFTIDHDGRLVHRAIATSSGDSALDAEALALLMRAQPFPTPPPDLPDAQLSFVVPIRFTTHRSP